MTLDDLQKTIHIQFKNRELLERAFVHRSHLNEAKHLQSSNERLEFLGDAVLSFLTSEYLYKTYPEYPEGTLTNIRSSLVKTQSLAGIAKKMGLGDLLLLSHGEEASGGRNNVSLLADCFEALLGAIFLDQDVDTARTFLTHFLFPEAKHIVENKTYVDYKSLFQEIVQQQSRTSPTYHVQKSEGPDHAKTFWVAAIAGGVTLGEGKGKSKQEAEQAAAANALEKMGK
jgi:ribonuclease-3